KSKKYGRRSNDSFDLG
ncbi:hypothetical protein D049_0343B, partial [Vibrio parahaemolyticus VPTS-2010]